MKYLVLIVICIALMAVILRAAGTPIVYKSNYNGDLCGCIVDKDYPTLDQCHDVGKRYELIWVDKCN